MQYSITTILLTPKPEGRCKKMKKYKAPELEITGLDVNDVITTSPGTETTPKDESDGIWDLSMNP